MLAQKTAKKIVEILKYSMGFEFTKYTLFVL